MNILYILGISVIIIFIYWLECTRFTKPSKKEKATVATLLLLGWILAILLIYFPEMPGPTQLIDLIFKPLGQLLE
jgi:hypothetical protein